MPVADNNLPKYAQAPKTATAVVTAAVGNLGTDAPTGLVALLTAGANGTIVTRLTAMPRASLLSASLLLYLSKDGTTMRLIDSETMAAQTFGAGAGIAETTFANYSETRPLRLAPGDMLYVGCQIAANIVFRAEYTDF